MIPCTYHNQSSECCTAPAVVRLTWDDHYVDPPRRHTAEFCATHGVEQAGNQIADTRSARVSEALLDLVSVEPIGFDLPNHWAEPCKPRKYLPKLEGGRLILGSIPRLDLIRAGRVHVDAPSKRDEMYRAIDAIIFGKND